MENYKKNNFSSLKGFCQLIANKETLNGASLLVLDNSHISTTQDIFSLHEES